PGNRWRSPPLSTEEELLSAENSPPTFGFVPTAVAHELRSDHARPPTHSFSHLRAHIPAGLYPQVRSRPVLLSSSESEVRGLPLARLLQSPVPIEGATVFPGVLHTARPGWRS